MRAEGFASQRYGGYEAAEKARTWAGGAEPSIELKTRLDRLKLPSRPIISHTYVHFPSWMPQRPILRQTASTTALSAIPRPNEWEAGEAKERDERPDRFPPNIASTLLRPPCLVTTVAALGIYDLKPSHIPPPKSAPASQRCRCHRKLPYRRA